MDAPRVVQPPRGGRARVRLRLRESRIGGVEVERAAVPTRRRQGVRRADDAPLCEPPVELRSHERARPWLLEAEAHAEPDAFLEREAFRDALASLAAEVDGFVREDDDRLARALAAIFPVDGPLRNMIE